MRTIAARLALFGIAGLLVLAAPQAPGDPAGAGPATGLIPLDAVQLAGIRADFPRVRRVGLNPLGLERVNEARAAKGKPPLDPLLVSPPGSEVEGVLPGAAAAALDAAVLTEASEDLPVSVDNSRLRFFPPIRNQGQLGSCASFASTYVQLSYMTAFARNLDIRDPADNTNKYSPKWSYDMLNGGKNEGTSLYENYILIQKHGAATWAEFPYDTDYLRWCLDPAAWRRALGVRTRAIQYVQDASSATGLALAKALLADGYVVVFGTYISSWVFKAAGNDPATSADDAAAGKQVAYYLNGSEGSHAMTIVGYNDAVWTDINGNGVLDAGEQGAFRIANTWGAGWYESGFTWLAYDALRTTSAVSGGPSTGRIAAIQGDLLYVMIARASYAPLLIGEFTVSHLKRNQLKMTLGRSGTTATSPSALWTPLALQNKGGAYAFDGSTTEIAGTFVLDFSDLLVQGAGAQRYYLGVNDNQTGDPATLSAFRIVDLTTDPESEAVSSLVPQTVDARLSYAYVDYAYAGPAVNDPPALSSPQVSPATGNAGSTFTFNVRYADPDGDVPTVKDLILDGEARPMTLISGQQPADGWYTLPLVLAAGPHSYAFYFEDGKGEWARAPLAGATTGPAVYGHVLTSLMPSGAMTGDPAFTLVANGADFADGAVVTWDGADRTTTFVSSARLDAAIPAGDLAAGKAVPVVVRNPNGVLSNVLTFTVSNPSPVLSSVAPASLSGGASEAVLTLHGTGFVPASVARWNGQDRGTTYFSPTEVRAALTSGDLSAAGEGGVAVVNPSPGGGTSQSLSCPVADFTAGVSPAQVTVAAGRAAVYAIDLAPRYASFESPIALSCAGLPEHAAAGFSPASVTPGAAAASATLTVSTSSRTASAAASAGAGGGSPLPPFLALLLAAAIPAILAVAARRGPSPAPARRLAAAAAVLLVLSLGGCGAGGGNSDPANEGTPPGTYTITVKATSGTLSVEMPVTLVVQ